MKVSMLIGGRKWVAWGLLTSIITNSTLLLMSNPAYADTCIAQDCANANLACNSVCMLNGWGNGHLLGQCVVGGSSFECMCANGRLFALNC